jgi:hypothetical protein
MLLLLLVSHSLSYFCARTIEVSSSSPRRFSYHGSDGDLICINATVPYLAVAFEHTSLLNVRYFTSTDNNALVRRGRFVFPSESAGIAFGNVRGHLEVQVLLSGIVSLSTFAYPTDCSEHRFFTTHLDDQLMFSSRLLHSKSDAHICLWSPHANYTIAEHVAAAESAVRATLHICAGTGDCADPPAMGLRQVIRIVPIPPGSFVEIDTPRETGLSIGFHVKKALRFLRSSGFLPGGVAASLIPVDGRRDAEPVAPAAPKKAPGWLPEQFPGKHPPQVLSSLEIIAALGAVVVVVVFLLQWFVCQATSKNPKPNSSEDDRTRLLSGYEQQMPYASPHAYAAGYYPPAVARGLFAPVMFPAAQPDLPGSNLV